MKLRLIFSSVLFGVLITGFVGPFALANRDCRTDLYSEGRYIDSNRENSCSSSMNQCLEKARLYGVRDGYCVNRDGYVYIDRGHGGHDCPAYLYDRRGRLREVIHDNSCGRSLRDCWKLARDGDYCTN